jgi:hypothetical protein
MARPRKAIDSIFYDVFSDMPVEEQAIALRICEQIYRLKQREPKSSAKSAPEVSGDTNGADKPKLGI